jgi:N-acetyl-anhydromuramyl-L-alanine amidase AmpD
MPRETELWPFIEAKHYKKMPRLGTRGARIVRVVVIHSAENQERADSAEALGRYFQKPDYVSSAHVGVDSNSICQYVGDSSIAYAAPGCNHDGIQIELTGRARQTRAQWLDQFGIAMLAFGADATAQYCLKFGLPVKRLTNAELKAGKKGIVGHHQVSEVYKRSDHTDPGSGFPWDYFLATTEAFWRARQ